MIRFLFLAATLTLPLAACQSVNTVTTNNPRRTNVDYSRIDMNPGLKNDVRVEGVMASEINGLLQGQVTLLNRSSSAKDIQTRFEWFSGQGMQVDESSTVWNTYTLQPGEMRSITGTAGSAKAKDFRFAIKPLR